MPSTITKATGPPSADTDRATLPSRAVSPPVGAVVVTTADSCDETESWSSQIVPFGSQDPRHPESGWAPGPRVTFHPSAASTAVRGRDVHRSANGLIRAGRDVAPSRISPDAGLVALPVVVWFAGLPQRTLASPGLSSVLSGLWCRIGRKAASSWAICCRSLEWSGLPPPQVQGSVSHLSRAHRAEVTDRLLCRLGPGPSKPNWSAL